MTNRRLTWRTRAVCSASGPTMIPGVSQRNSTGRSKASHSCRKRAALSAPSASMAPAEVRRGCWRRRPAGRPSTRTSAVTMPEPERRPAARAPSRRRRARRPRRARRRRCSRFSGTTSRAASRVRRRPLVGRALEVRRGTAGRRRRPRPRRRRRRRRRRSAPARPSGRWPRAGTRRGRRPRPSPGRPCRCSSPSVAITTSQQPRMAALPAKQRPLVMPTSGTSPLSRPNRLKARQSRPDTPVPSVSPGRPPPPSVKNTTGQPLALGHARTAGPSCGGSAGPGCRRGPCSRTTSRPRGGRRPCRRRRRARRPGVRSMRSSSSRRRRWAAMTSGPYSTRLPSIEQVVDVLAGRALPGAAAPLDGVGPGVVEPDVVAGPHLGQVGPLAGASAAAAGRPRRRRPRRARAIASRSPACTTSPAATRTVVDGARLRARRRCAPSSSTRSPPPRRRRATGAPTPGDPHHRALQRRPDLDHAQGFYWLRSHRGGAPVALSDHGCQPLPRPDQREGGRLRRRLRHLRADARPRARTTSAASTSRAATSCSCVTRPDVIAKMHDDFFQVGVDVIETATFGAFAVPLGEYGIGEQSHEINLAAARIAREVADGHGGLVAGSIGPGHQVRLARPDPLRRAPRRLRGAGAAACSRAASTCCSSRPSSTCSAPRPAMIGCRRAMAAAGREVPIQVQVTMELTGTMLPGTEIGAALAALDAMRPDVIGINCATGPAEMSEHLRYLGQHSRMPIACLPNAGLPSVVEGQMHYDLTPDQLAEYQSRFVRDFGVQVVGGCCGTTVEHIKALVEAVKDLTPAPRTIEHEDGATSIYSFTPFEQQLTYLSIGERTNANGSKKFREAMLEGDWDTCVAMAREQEKEGAHVLDVCVDYVGRDGTADMDEIASPLRHPGHRPADDRLHRAAGHRDGAAVDRRPGHPQLGQPRGRRRARHPPRPLPVARPRVRRRRRLHLHRRGGPGPHARVEAEGGQGDPRHRRRPLRPRARRPVLRPARPHARHGHGGVPRRRRLHARGHPAHQGEPARRAHHARALEHLLRPQPGRPPRPQLGVPPRGGPGRARLRHRARRPHHAAGSHPRGAEEGLPRRHLRPAHRRLRPAAGAALDVRGRHRRVGREGGPLRLVDREAPLHPHHRRRPRRPRRRPRRRAGRRPHAARRSSTTSSSRG